MECKDFQYIKQERSECINLAFSDLYILRLRSQEYFGRLYHGKDKKVHRMLSHYGFQDI